MPNNGLHNVTGALNLAPVSLGMQRKLSGWTSGAPVLTGITGTFTNGGALTISGSNLSTNRSGQLYYHTFDGGVAGQAALAGKGFNVGADAQYLYQTTGAPAGRSTFAQRDTLGKTNDDSTAARLQLGQLSRVTMHVDFRLETPDRTGTPGNGAQDKLFRLVGGASDLHTQGAGFGWVWLYEDNGNPPSTIDWFTIYNSAWSGTTPSMPSPGIVGIQGLWGRFTMMWQASSGVDVPDGRMLMKSRYTHAPTANGQPYHSQDGAYPAASWKMSPVNTRKGTDVSPYMQQLFIPFYQRDSQHSVWSMANLFVNDSFEQVLFGNASTLEACDPAKIICQPMTARTLTTVPITGYYGPNNELATGAVYAYVFNEDGSYNEAGLLVRAS